MSTIINSIPKTHENYSKRQRYEFEVFDKSIKEIENLFKQDINTFKRPKFNQLINQNYTYKHETQECSEKVDLDDYLRKDKRNDSYKSLFIPQNQPSRPQQDEYHQLREIYKKKQLQLKQTQNTIDPAIITYIRSETRYKIEYYVNDITSIIMDQDYSELGMCNEDGLVLWKSEIAGNLRNIIEGEKQT